MNKSKASISKNYIYNLVYQIIKIIIPLVTTPYLSRVLGAESIGIYSYTLSIATYFILFGSLGVAMYGQREIAYVQDDIELRSKKFFEILIMKFITMSISLLIFYTTFCINGEYSTYFKILIIEILADCVDISWFFQGLEEFKKVVLRNTLIRLISTSLIFLLVKSSVDLAKYIWIYVLANFIGNVSIWIYLPQYVKKVQIKKLQIFKNLKPTVALFIPQIAIQVYNVLDKTMLGMLIDDKSEVGFYEQAQKIVKLLLTITTSLGTVMIPRIANTFAKGENEKLKGYLSKSFDFVLFLAFPLMLGIISISSKFVPIFYGEGYEKVTSLICVISPIIVIIGLSNIIGMQYLLPTRRQKEFTISVTAGAIINFICNIFLIQKFQSIGASIATIIAESAVTIIQFYIVRKDIKVFEVLKNSKNYIMASILMFAVTYFFNYIILEPIISIIIQIIIGSIIYFGILFIKKDEIIQLGINKIKSVFIAENSRK